jgi:hypothetical protein
MGQRLDSTGGTVPSTNSQPYYINRMEFVYSSITPGSSANQSRLYGDYIAVEGSKVKRMDSAAGYRIINTLKP